MLKAKNSGVLRLTIVAAAGLAPADRNGLSDPYALISKSFFTSTKGKEIRTRVEKKTLNPKWDEAFEFWLPDVRDFSFQISLWDWDLAYHDSLGYTMVKSRMWEEFYRVGKEEKWMPVEDAEGQLLVRLEATDAALRVLRRLQQEQDELERQKRLEQLRIERQLRIKHLCEERMREIKEATPLFVRKGFDPMLILFIVAALLLVAHIGFQIWLSLDVIIGTWNGVYIPAKGWALWGWDKSHVGFFMVKDWLIHQYQQLKGVPDMPIIVQMK